jgi:hypothetical protein
LGDLCCGGWLLLLLLLVYRLVLVLLVLLVLLVNRFSNSNRAGVTNSTASPSDGNTQYGGTNFRAFRGGNFVAALAGTVGIASRIAAAYVSGWR